MNRKLCNILDDHAWNIIHCLNLSHFKITVSDEYLDKGKQKRAMGENSSMEISVNYKYLKAEIWYNKKIAENHWKNKNKEIVIGDLIHEICHIVIDELYFEYVDKTKIKEEDIANTYREQATEQISRWGWNLYDEYMKKHNIKIETGLATKKK